MIDGALRVLELKESKKQKAVALGRLLKVGIQKFSFDGFLERVRVAGLLEEFNWAYSNYKRSVNEIFIDFKSGPDNFQNYGLKNGKV